MSDVRVRVVNDNDKYIIQVYNNSGFNMKVKNCGPYKTKEGAFRGARKWMKVFHYTEEQLDKEVKEEEKND